MKLVVLFLFFCALGFTAQAQDDCPQGAAYFPTCTAGVWDKCMDGYYPETRGGKKMCICGVKPVPKKPKAKKQQEQAKKAVPPVNVPVVQELFPPEPVGDKKTFTPVKDPTEDILLKNVKEIVPDPKVEVDVVAVSQLPTAVTQTEEKTTEEVIPKWYRVGIGPFIEIGGESNKNPQFVSKFLWATTVGLTLRSEFIGGPAKGLGFNLSPGYMISMGKSFIPETTPSPYPVQETRLNGLIVSASVDYKLDLHPLIIQPGVGYAWSPKKELPHLGVFAGLELGVENVPIRIAGGVIYKKEVEYFIGLRLVKEFWF